MERRSGAVRTGKGIEPRFVAAAATGEFDREAYAREAQKALR